MHGNAAMNHVENLVPLSQAASAETMQEGRSEQTYEVSSQAVRRELRAAIRELRDVGMHRASAWAAEQLVGLRGDDPMDDHTLAASLNAPEPHVNGGDSDTMLLARRLFDAKVRCHQCVDRPHEVGSAVLDCASWRAKCATTK